VFGVHGSLLDGGPILPQHRVKRRNRAVKLCKAGGGRRGARLYLRLRSHWKLP
jgi:hypothetical protein